MLNYFECWQHRNTAGLLSTKNNVYFIHLKQAFLNSNFVFSTWEKYLIKKITMQITTLYLREYRALTRGILLIEVPHDNQN